MAAGTRPGYQIGRSDDGLTAREREVLERIKQGERGLTIASALGISKQRVAQIEKALIEKKHVVRVGDDLAVRVPRKG